MLVSSRVEALEALRTGFNCVKELRSHLSLLSTVDLQLLVRGREFLSAEQIIPALSFRGFPPHSQTHTHLKQLLSSLSATNLVLFLLFATEQESIPVGGLQNPNPHSPYPRDQITVCCRPASEDLPQARVCMYQIDLPDVCLSSAPSFFVFLI